MPNNLKLNPAGFRKLRTLPVMDGLVLKKAQQIADAAGPGYKAVSSPSKNRARAVVFPDTAEEARELARYPEILLNAMRAARD